jgi:hypothetical protein
MLVDSVSEAVTLRVPVRLSDSDREGDMVPVSLTVSVLDVDNETLGVIEALTDVDWVPDSEAVMLLVSEPDCENDGDAESDDDMDCDALAVSEALYDIDGVSVGVSDAEADGDGDSDGAPPPSHTARSDGIRHVTDENDADTTTHAAVVPSITISFPTVLFSKPVPLSVISVPPAVLPDDWDTDDTTSGYVSCGTPAASLANPALFANTFTTIGYSPAGAWSTVHRISVVEADVTLHTDTLPMYTKLSPISAPNPLPVITNSSPTVILDFDRAVTTGVRASSYV